MYIIGKTLSSLPVNLNNISYFTHIYEYLKHLAYSFTINNTNTILMLSVLLIFFVGLILLIKKSKEKFVILLTIIPSIIYFFIATKLTSLQELRYIMPVIPFISIIVFLIFDTLFKFKYKNAVIILIAIILSLNGFIFSKPKFLFEEYRNYLEIAE